MARKASKDEPALTHIDASGEARMVDVSAKPATERIAVAEGCVVMSKATLELIVSGNAKKGDVLGTARVAGIMAAKRTSDLIRCAIRSLCRRSRWTLRPIGSCPAASSAPP